MRYRTGVPRESFPMKLTFLLFPLLGLAIACTVGCGPSAQEKREALDNLTSKVGQQSTQLEIENVRLTLKIVEQIQGPEAAQEMDVCLSKGYEIDFATVDGANEWVSRLADGSSLSNRRKAECDAIVKAVNHHWERQTAEEKRKDDAYDKAHAVKKK